MIYVINNATRTWELKQTKEVKGNSNRKVPFRLGRGENISIEARVQFSPQLVSKLKDIVLDEYVHTLETQTTRVFFENRSLDPVITSATHGNTDILAFSEALTDKERVVTIRPTNIFILERYVDTKEVSLIASFAETKPGLKGSAEVIIADDKNVRTIVVEFGNGYISRKETTTTVENFKQKELLEKGYFVNPYRPLKPTDFVIVYRHDLEAAKKVIRDQRVQLVPYGNMRELAKVIDKQRREGYKFVTIFTNHEQNAEGDANQNYSVNTVAAERVDFVYRMFNNGRIKRVAGSYPKVALPEIKTKKKSFKGGKPAAGGKKQFKKPATGNKPFKGGKPANNRSVVQRNYKPYESETGKPRHNGKGQRPAPKK